MTETTLAPETGTGIGTEAEARPVRSRAWSPRLDDGRYPRAKIGFVAIPNEQTIEEDMYRWLPEGCGAFFSRATMPREISVESLARLKDTLADTASRILADDGIDVVAFACTSGTVAVGEEAALAELRRGAPGAKPTTLAGAVRKAVHAVGARRIVLGTPYIDSLNTAMAAYFRGAGIELADVQGLGLEIDHQMVRVTPDYLVEFAEAIDRPDADAVVISCGALRTIDVIGEIERRLGKPAICSNQAMLWDCLRLAGVEDRIEGLGRLLTEH